MTSSSKARSLAAFQSSAHMSAQLPTSPDGLSLLELQSTLEALRSLRATRPAKLREASLCLAKFSEQIWTETSNALRQNDPERLERVVADQDNAKTRIIIASVVIVIIVGLFASQQYLPAGGWPGLCGGVVLWVLHTLALSSPLGFFF